MTMVDTDLHPIITQMRPSAEQHRAIVTRDCDLVVTAGAGAGKTLTLVARYLAQLAEGLPLRGIIAITFTEKAAREMRNRVRNEVRRYLEAGDLTQVEFRRWQDIYSELDAARISTIHGLCAEILRSHPAEARIDPYFAVLDEGQSTLQRRQAIDTTLAWMTETPDLVPLFTLLGENRLRDTLDTLLRRQPETASIFATLPNDLLGHWQTTLATRQSAELAALLAQPAWQDAAATVQCESTTRDDDRMEIQRQIAAAALRDAERLSSLDDGLAALARLADIKLVGGSAKAWPGGADQLGKVKNALKRLRDAWGACQTLQLRLNSLDEQLAAAMAALRTCFEKASAIYTAAKDANQALDFDDLETQALALLASNPAVRARWQRESAAVLVDEFQDTNDRQRQLVRLLAGQPGKLFIVGDAKQSIYRFRGADVVVFRAERAAIARAGGADLCLETSYRAHRALIEGLNDLLRPVLGEKDDPQRPWVEPFAPLRHHRARAADGLDAPFIEVHLAVGAKSEGGLVRAAEILAARLTAWVAGGGVQIEEDGRPRPLHYGDVAILCRASTSFAAYEDALERAGIPFLTVAGGGFYGRFEIRDLLNALTALADPTDDLALVGLLRSPAVALSDVALYRLCMARDQTDPAPSLWQILRAVGAELPGEDGSRAARAAVLIADLHAQAGRVPVADLLKTFLDDTGYVAALLAAGQMRAVRNVAKLLDDAHNSGLVGVGEFLAYVVELRDSGAREGEARATSEGAVQIMSVHAAKGLEFPVVVIGDITYKAPTRHGVLFDPVLGVLLALKDDEKQQPAIDQLGQLTADDQEAAESDRLLYVAATRAREKLILSGCVTVKKDRTAGMLGGWLGRLCEVGVLPLGDDKLDVHETSAEPQHLDCGVGASPVSCTIYGSGYVGGTGEADRGTAARPQPSTHTGEPAVPLPPPLLAAVEAERVVEDSRAAVLSDDPGQRVWRVVPAVARSRAPAWVVGKLVHEALAAWRFPDDEGFFARWVVARARSYGLTDAQQLADASQRSRTLLGRFRQHPLYAQMTGASPRLHEVPYSRVTETGRVESGVIDALFQRDGNWTMVEFKTDHIRDAAGLDRLLMEEDYLVQTARYVAAVEQLLGLRPMVVLCLLDYAGSIHVQ